MSRNASLKSRPTGNPGLPWLVNLPSRFTSSGKRERHFFKKKTEADEFARRQRIRLQNYGSSASVLPAGRVEEAAIAFEQLAPFGVTLTEVVGDFVARRRKEAKSISLKEAFKRFEEHKPKRRSEAYRQQLERIHPPKVRPATRHTRCLDLRARKSKSRACRCPAQRAERFSPGAERSPQLLHQARMAGKKSRSED